MITVFLRNAALVELMIANMGALPTFAAATQEGTSIVANYGALDAIGKVDVLLDALPRGAGLSADQQRGLKGFFDATPDGSLARLQKILGIRYDFVVGDDGTRAAVHNTVDAAGNPDTTLQPWTAELLRKSWEVLASLPPGHVAGNDSLDWFLRKNDGSSYYWSHDESIAMGHSNLTDVDTGYNLQLPGETNPFPYNLFKAHLRHEVGHSVDRKLGISAEGGYATTAESAGRWKEYGSGGDWVDALLAEDGGVTGANADAYKKAAKKAVSENKDLNVALADLRTAGTVAATVPDAPDGGAGYKPLAAIFQTSRWTDGGAPWDSNGWRPVGARNWHRGYSGSRWVSFLAASRAAYRVSNYQWRAPGEWFAGLYAAYYAELDEGPDPATGRPRRPGTRLRNRSPGDAAWFDTHVDQGFSMPQELGVTGGSAGAGSAAGTASATTGGTPTGTTAGNGATGP
jgi:hypothetical protein